MSKAPEYSGRSVAPPRQIVATVVEHQEVAPAHYKMRIAAADIAAGAQAGQFVHVLPRNITTRDPLLRRAFSIMAVTDDDITILYRIMGRGTAWLSTLDAGSNVNLIGPLGKPFAPLSESAILVGGGVGVPPLVMLASTATTGTTATGVETATPIASRGDAKTPAPEHREPGTTQPNLVAIVGARTHHDLIGLAEFEQLGVPVLTSTDDGSAGHHGRVTDLLEAQLTNKSECLVVYSCGPFAMLRAVAALCQKYNVPCQVSLEENMPCGVGICNGCVVPVVGSGDDYGRYRRICVDGPVAWAHEIDWEHLAAAAACY